ncbi:MAG: hypothetical protein U0835_16290 [Isosphaeraceae bacterium]
MVTIRTSGPTRPERSTVNGTIVVTRSKTQGASSFFTFGVITPATITLGNLTYSLSSPTYTALDIDPRHPARAASRS